MRVCILGSGLTALTLAKALVNQNIFVDLISSNKNHKINHSRTIGISESNFNYFNKNISNIEKISWKLKKIEIYTDKNKNKNEKILNFENSNNQLFSIIKNYQLYEVLNKGLFKNKYFKKIKSKKKLIKIEKYNLIVNTEYNNVFTKKYFSKKIEKVYNSSAYTTVINHKTISNQIAVQIFTKIGPLAFLPLSKNKTSIVYSIYNSKDVDRKKIIHLINQHNIKYKITKIQKIENFELKSFNLRSYYYNNILAFGDLLHRIHPLAGQGFNMTIRDINVFIRIIKNKINLGLPIDSSVNYEFEKNLKHKNYIFSNSIDFVQEFFNFERKLNNNVLSKSLKILGKNSYINKLFTKVADKGINF
ncbi:FAD-dependent monooxygenase [Candidatus Pelagibacter communis]|uniref:FAD-dependent monooxygenase n=1 Tax=Pelagibacter ubique TaxID=198252 RepID=UPI000ACB93F5|nr:FAD-dependent monooxygenase [Candidatus Pelagibacter ubique]